MEPTLELFRHVTAEKAVMYRCIMDAFAAARRQYRLQLRPDEVEILMQRAEEKPDTKVIVDLESQSVGIQGEEWTMHFDIDPFVKHMLTNGLDDISLTLQSADAIDTYESKRPSFLPTTVA